MPHLFSEWSAVVRKLHERLLTMESECQSLQIRPLAQRDWFQLLEQKLLPQLTDNAFLVVAVVGGTNIGKSVIFNHLAGCRASAASPLASGTKHPVCLVPANFVGQHALHPIFPDFSLEPWSSSEGALTETSRDLLFWRESESTPKNLLVLDTPDIDSDAPVNWDRADRIRRSADVLIGVLTQQKYNDAAVKQFFRHAAAEEKSVILVFNQCQLPDDEEYWPLWLETFTKETACHPEYVYVAPNDRQAAENNELPFYSRRLAAEQREQTPHSLLKDLSQHHFREIKLRTLRGSIQQLTDPTSGVPKYLEEISERGSEFRAAAELLGTHRLAEVENWPAIPPRLLVQEIRRWWASHRQGWSRRVHTFYNNVGNGLAWPFRAAKKHLQGPPEPPIEAYRRLEWQAILEIVETVYERLTWIADLGNELLRPRLEKLLAGRSRADLISILQTEHEEIDLEAGLRETVNEHMKTFHEESPKSYQFFKRLDTIAAAARPATSLALFVAGFGPAGDVAGQMVADGAIQSVVHVAGDVAGGTVAATVGETALSSTTATGMGYVEAKFRNLHTAFSSSRATWLAGRLQEHLLGDLPHELQHAAGLTESTTYRELQHALAQVAEQCIAPETTDDAAAATEAPARDSA